MTRSRTLMAIGLMVLGGSPLMATPGPLESSRKIRSHWSLDAEACPLTEGHGVPAYYRESLSGGWRQFDVALLLPLPAEEARAFVLDPTTWPDWAMSPVGEPGMLSGLNLDEEAGRLSFQFAFAGDEGGLSGKLRRARSRDLHGLRFTLDGALGPIKGFMLDLAVRPSKNCEAASEVYLRLAFRFGFLARTFGGEQKSHPILLAMALRADLLARCFESAPALSRLLGQDLSTGEHGLVLSEQVPVATQDLLLSEGDTLLRAAPTCTTNVEARAELERLKIKKVNLPVMLAAMVRVIDGSTEVHGARLFKHGVASDETVTVGCKKGDVSLQVRFGTHSLNISWTEH